MAWTKAGNIFSQTGTETGYAGAVAAGYMTYVGDAALKVVQITAANDLMNINGTFDDSGWTVIYKSTSGSSGGSRFLVGANAVWTSGSEIDGIPQGGATHIEQNTGISWGVNSQLTAGCRLNWYNVKIVVKGDGFLQLLDNAAGSNTHILKGLTIDATGTTHRWQMVNIKNSIDSYADLIGVDFTTKGAGAFPSIRSWRASGSADISVLPDDAAQSGGIGSTNTFVGLSVNFLTAGQKLRLSNHGGKIATYRLENSFINPTRVTLSSNPNANATTHVRWFNNVSTKVLDLAGLTVSDATVVVKNLSSVKSSGTTNVTGDFVTPLIETYYATATNGSSNVGLETIPPTVTDGRLLDVRVRKPGFIEQTYSNNSNILGVISKSFALIADSDFTGTAAQAAALTGIAFVYNSGTNTVSVDITGAVTGQEIYNYWSYWNSLSAQMGSVVVPFDRVYISSGGLFINGSLTTADAINAGGNVSRIVTTGLITINSGGSINMPYEDSTGIRASITGLDIDALGNTWRLGYLTKANYDARTVGTPPIMWTGLQTVSGTGNSTNITLAANTEYVFLNPRIAGYSLDDDFLAPVYFDTTTATSLSFTKKADRDLQSTIIWGLTSADAGYTNISYNSSTQFVEYDNQTLLTTTVGFYSAYRALQEIVNSADLAFALTSPLRLNSTKDGFVLTTTNPLKARMTAASTAAGILAADVAYTSGTPALDRFKPNSSHDFLFLPIPSARLSSDDISQVRSGLALESTVSTRASQTSVNAIPTNPLLATDARLNNLDTTVSSRLAAASYTEPPTVAAIRADIERTGGMLDTVPTLAEVEASTVLAKQSGFTGLATAANVTNAQTAIVTEINANETKIDAVKTDTAAIKLKTDALVNAPTLAQIEASTVLAKQSGFAGLATAANVVDAQTAIVTEVNANETKIDAIKVDTAAIKAKTDTLVNTDISGLPTLTQIEASSVLAKASDVSTVDTKVTAIKAKTDTLVNAPTVADIEASTVLAKEATVASKASQSSVNALGSPMQASDYVAPDNTKIAEIKTKVDTLQNTDLTAVNSGIADIKGTGFDATKHNLVKIKQQASLAAALSA